MAVSSFHEELMEAKVTLLQYDNLLRELKRVSYLKQEGDEDFSHEMNRVVELFDRLNGDLETRDEVKNCLNYEFDFSFVEECIKNLKMQSENEFNYEIIKKRVGRMCEVLGEKRDLGSKLTHLELKIN